MSERPRGYLADVVPVPRRIAHELERRLDLEKLRRDTRGRDREWDDVLLLLHFAALDYRNSLSLERRLLGETGETAESSVVREIGTDEAAARLALSPRRVQQLAKDGELVEEQRARRWIFTTAAVTAYERTRSQQ